MTKWLLPPMSWHLGLCVTAIWFAAPTLAEIRGAEVNILPAQVSLSGPLGRHRLVVQRSQEGQEVGDVTSDAILTSSDPAVVRVDGSMVVATGNGTATITAQVGDGVATAQVLVEGMDQQYGWSFRNHVQSVLAKAGCSSGACHGALAGKAGFKLSLRGYDTQSDFLSITRQARGRRIELSDPGRSLILAKPTSAIPHKGGLRFDVDSLEYRVLSEWIAQGARPPREEDARIQRLEVLPRTALLGPGSHQQLIVRAVFDNGQVEDVTRWAKFTSTNETVATVDDQGRLTVIGHGEGAVTAWYLSKLVIARVVSPYDNRSLDEAIANADRHNFIDHMALEKLASLRLPPSVPADDATFLRRAYLDTIGKLPSADEVRTFLADSSADKRLRLIDILLARPEFVDYWTYKLSDVLLVTGKRLRPKAVQAYYQWIRSRVTENTPWDEFARLIVTATGSSFENGATNFYALHQDPLEMAENTTMAFLGLNINCARCHNHPLEKWTNDQYYAMANLFARVRAKGWGGPPSKGDGLRTLYVSPDGDLIQPLSGRPQPPTPLDGTPIRLDDPRDRRVALASWLTTPENPYFSRAIVNRIWANFFGVGLVENVDDLRTTNPASNEALLSATAQYLVDHQFDLKAVMRLILRSGTYQRSSRPLPENREDTRYYSRYYPRRLMAEVLLDAISDVTGVSAEFTELSLGSGVRTKIDAYPKGTRAIQLSDSAVTSYFLKTFGRNERLITCECERSNKPSMVQVLHIANGTTINDRLAAPDSCVSRLIADEIPDDEMVEKAFLSTLSRYPTHAEQQQLGNMLAQASPDERREVIEDLFWAILSSREFLFNR